LQDKTEELKMKKTILLVLTMLFALRGLAFSETFFWEDKKGIHMTDDVSKLPLKLREKYEKLIKQQPKQEVKSTKIEKVVIKTIPESAKNAVKALKKLEARCQAGISYRDYSPALGDAKFDVNMFIETNDAKELEKLRLSIMKSIQHYEYANIIWQLRFALEQELYDVNSSFASGFFAAYPEANKKETEGGIIDDKYNKIFFQTAISYVFSTASKELTNSFALLNKQ
jgi:hypothetical protein